MEDLLYEAASVRRFVGLKLSEALPDETTHPELPSSAGKAQFGVGLLAEINEYLAERGGYAVAGGNHRGRHHHRGAVVHQEPSNGERDPEMHQTKKGNEWHFGMKLHIGVDADTGLVHAT